MSDQSSYIGNFSISATCSLAMHSYSNMYAYGMPKGRHQQQGQSFCYQTSTGYSFGFFVKQGKVRAVSFTIPILEKQNDKGVLVFLNRGNGQIKTDKISGEGNHNTALFWEYDTGLGRRWNVDPKPQIKISDYACFGDNPVTNSDKLGDVFDKESESTLQNIKSEINDKITEAKFAKSAIQAKTREVKSEKKLKALNLELENIEKQLSEMQSAIVEIAAMEKSKIIFSFAHENANVALSSGSYSSNVEHEGRTYYKNGKVVMSSNGITFNRNRVLVHELKHGYQFLTGKLSFSAVTGQAGLLLDAQDENEGYARDKAFVTKPGRSPMASAPANVIQALINVNIDCSSSMNMILDKYNYEGGRLEADMSYGEAMQMPFFSNMEIYNCEQ
jgi:hypothetical protein